MLVAVIALAVVNTALLICCWQLYMRISECESAILQLISGYSNLSATVNKTLAPFVKKTSPSKSTRPLRQD